MKAHSHQLITLTNQGACLNDEREYADLPPAFARSCSFSLRSKVDDDSNAHSKSVKKTISSTLRNLVSPREDKEDKAAKDKAAEALKIKLASRWSQVSEMRKRAQAGSSAVNAEPPKRKNERTEEGAGGREKNHTKRIEEKRSKKTDLLSHSKSHPKSSRIIDPKKTGLRKSRSTDLDGSNHSCTKRIEEKRSKSTDLLSHSKSHPKSIIDPKKTGLRRNRSTDLDGSNHSCVSLLSNSSSSSRPRSQSVPRSSHSKPTRQPRSLAQPEKLAPWQIREQAKHRASAPIAGINLYNRRLDDDEEEKAKKPKVRKTSSKKTVSAVGSPRGTKERKQLKSERSTQKTSLHGSLPKLDDSECNLPPAAQPEKLAPWQIREEAKHRSSAPTAGTNLYNRRLDDDDSIVEEKAKKPKVRKT
jgi:hypothetical protein